MPLDRDHDPRRTGRADDPEANGVGPAQQGTLLVEPYKSEMLPHVRFRTPQVARASADAIYALYLDYRNRKDFVGMDMARKFLQMGYNRARRSARSGPEVQPDQPDPKKAEAAVLFRDKWQLVRSDPEYQRLLAEHRHPEESSDPQD